jgi:type II secretion system protein H
MKTQYWCGFASINGLKRPSIIGFQSRFLLSRNSGFTLIEVLVVTIILGIALSLAVANLIPDEREKVRIEAERVLVLLEQVRDESAMSGKAIAVEVRENTMQFYERDQKSVETKWLPLETLNGSVISARPFANGTIGDLYLGSLSSNTAKPAGPSALATFQPAGVAAPFELKIQSAASAQNVQTIRVDALGNLSLSAISKDVIP